VSRLLGRIDRLERRERTLAGARRHDDRPTIEDCFNALTTREEREEFLVLVKDVHAIQQREVEAMHAGLVPPARNALEQARMDELDRFLSEVCNGAVVKGMKQT